MIDHLLLILSGVRNNFLYTRVLKILCEVNVRLVLKFETNAKNVI